MSSVTHVAKSEHKIVSDVQDMLEEKILPGYSNWHDVLAFYYDWNRRAEALMRVLGGVPSGSRILDAGSAPGFMSLALRALGYWVASVDVNPEPYRSMLEKTGIVVVRADLEKDVLPFPDECMEAVVFTEVLEHLHPAKINFFVSELNRVLKRDGLLLLTTPNLAALSRRLKLLFGRPPTPKFHTKEYTLKGVSEMLDTAGFNATIRTYSLAYNTIPFGAKGRDLRLGLLRGFWRYPNAFNVFRVVTLPLLYAVPSLGGTVVVEARKERYVRPEDMLKEDSNEE